jgi:hypothetical protein
MASEGPLSGGTFSTSAIVGSKGSWDQPSRLGSSDDSRTENSFFDGYSDYVTATNFGFAIPADATIDGIVVEWEKRDQGQSSLDHAVRIIKGGTIGSTDKANATDWPDADAYVSYGANNDLWGETWSDSDINDSGFGAALAGGRSGGGAVLNLDHVRITVYYTEGGGGGGVKGSVFRSPVIRGYSFAGRV